jgi:hypothetical protein
VGRTGVAVYADSVVAVRLGTGLELWAGVGVSLGTETTWRLDLDARMGTGVGV